MFGARSAGAHRRRRADLDQPRLDAGGARDDRPPAGGGRRHRQHRDGRDADDGPAGGRGADASRGWSSCGPCSRRFRCTARSSSRAASRTRTRCSQNHGVLVRPELLTALGVKVGDSHRPSARRTFTIRGVITKRAGPPRRRASASGPRVLDRLRRSAGDRPARLRQPGAPRHPGQGARDRASSRWSARCARDFKDEFVNARSYRVDRRRDRPRLRSRRELPEPGRPGHRDPRRHRRVERHARLRPAEDAQHRRAEVRRRAQRADHRRLHPAGADARSGRQPARRRARARRDCGDSAGARATRRRSWRRCDYGVTWSAACRGSASACWCRCCSRSCRCCRCGSSSRRCCCATRRSQRRRDWTRHRPPWSLVSAALVALTAWQAASLQVGLVVCAGFCGLAARAAARRTRLLVARDRAARQLAVVPAAPRGAAPVAARQPDARHPARRRPRRVLHRRRPIAAGEPARGVLDPDRAPTRPTCS